MEENLNENNVNNFSDTIYDDMGLLYVSLDGKNEKEVPESELLENNSLLGSSDNLYPFRYTDNSDLVVYDEQNEVIISELQTLNSNIVVLDSGLKIITACILFFLFLYCFRWAHLRTRR